MLIALRIFSGLVALLFLVNGFQWIFSPANVAESLRMPLLEGSGASTQIGDLGSFFLVGGIMMALGQLPGRSIWFYPPAMLIFGAAVIRTLAALLGNASLELDVIVLEVVMSAILYFTASKLAEAEGA